MYAREHRVLLRHYLEQGLSKAGIARTLGVSRRTVYHWIDTGQLDRDLDGGPARYGPRPEVTRKIDRFREMIRWRGRLDSRWPFRRTNECKGHEAHFRRVQSDVGRNGWFSNSISGASRALTTKCAQAFVPQSCHGHFVKRAAIATGFEPGMDAHNIGGHCLDTRRRTSCLASLIEARRRLSRYALLHGAQRIGAALSHRAGDSQSRRIPSL